MTGAVKQARACPRAQLSLASEFQLHINDRSIAVPHGVQRLLAFLAIAQRPIPRSRIAGQLWFDVAEGRALGNLRSALWRLRRIPQIIVRKLDERLTLDPEVDVDIAELTEFSGRVLKAKDPAMLQSLSRLMEAAEILPGWEDDWLVVERERFRELRLRALEHACEMLMASGDHAGAVQAGLAAIEAEPFRESAQRLLVQVHLTEGNRAAALRSYYAYRDLVGSELGIEPSELMNELVADLTVKASVATTHQ